MHDDDDPNVKDGEGDEVNPHLTRDGSSRMLDIETRFGRHITKPSASWAPMEKPGTPRYVNAVDRVFKLHQRCAHASCEKLEHIIANSINTGCVPGDTRYMPVCNECLIGGYDTTRAHQRSPSTTMISSFVTGVPASTGCST